MKVDSAPPIKRFIAASLFLTTFTPALAPLPVLADSVRIAGQQVFQVNTGTSTLTPTKRAEAIQSNLDNAIVASKDKPSTPVSVTYVNGLPVITLCGYQICTVDGADAKQANTTPALLAQRWCDALRKSLSDKPSISSYIAQLSGSIGSNASADNSSSNNTVAPPPAPPISSVSTPSPADSYSSSSSSPSPLAPPQAPTLAAQTPMAAPSNYPPSPYAGNTQTSAYPPSNSYPPPQQPQSAAYGYTSYGANYSVQPPPPSNFAPPPSPYGQPPAFNGLRGSVGTAPAGTVINATLKISISTDVAQSGDPVEACILDSVAVQNGSIPTGSILLGNITQSRASGRLSQSGHLGMKFTSLRLPDGTVTPITAHLTGVVGKYKFKGSGDDAYLQGEGGKAKLGQTLIRGGVGAGAGAALGTAVGAIAGGPFGAGTGAWSGAAIGGGIGVADMALRKGREVKLESGTHLQIQLDQPATIPGPGNTYAQGLQGT